MNITDKMLDRYRDVNVQFDDWYDFVYENFIDRMRPLGIEIDPKKVWFSGFWSQGDGACFEADVHFPTFAAAHDLLKDRPMVQTYLQAGGEITVTMCHIGRYYHEYSVEIGVVFENDFMQLLDTDIPLVAACIEDWDKDLECEYARLEKETQDILRSYMRDLYHALKQEYDYLTSDEAVREWIEANLTLEEAA